MSDLGETGRTWMPRCLELAQKGAGRVSPNPMVGAVVLDRRGQLVGEGHHKKAGGHHAEVYALNAAGERARGGTLIVNLEPCNHHGRTPPCSERIEAAGVARVVYGASDPVADHAGGGRALRRAGLAVRGGILRRECEQLNRVFFTVARLGRPHVVVKAAATLDGKSATKTGESKWITSESARADGRRLRGELDAICVGIGTVLADDPRLTSRRRGSRDPLRIVFDAQLRTPPSAQLLPANSESGAGCLIVTSAAASRRREARLTRAGAEVLRLGRRAKPRAVDLLAELGVRDVASVLVEGGPTLVGSFFAADLVDELRLYQGPLVFGAGARSWLAGSGVAALASAPRFDIASIRQLGPDVAITAFRRR